jgi:hypothetical protein
VISCGQRESVRGQVWEWDDGVRSSIKRGKKGWVFVVVKLKQRKAGSGLWAVAVGDKDMRAACGVSSLPVQGQHRSGIRLV